MMDMVHVVYNPVSHTIWSIHQTYQSAADYIARLLYEYPQYTFVIESRKLWD